MIPEHVPHRTLHHPPDPARSPSTTVLMFIVGTNVSLISMPEGFLFELTQQLEQATSKLAQYIKMPVVPDQLLTFIVSSDP